jgi:hypothetical protein
MMTMDKKEKELLFDNPVEWLKSSASYRERCIEDNYNWYIRKREDLHRQHLEDLVVINEAFADKLNKARALLESAGIKWEDVVSAATEVVEKVKEVE